MPPGCNGKILLVDLATSTFRIEVPRESFYRQYAGGSALGLYYLLRDLPPRVDPLSPDNILCLSLSVLTGAPISGQSRLMANAKSPLTGAAGDSQAGGFFPAELKFAGYDAIVIRGRSPTPVYLWIRDGIVEVRDARHLWGKLTGEVERLLREELGDDKVEIAQIGPAGEDLVRFAAIINMASRANGRTGMGAVMGSKNLKAVAVRGTRGAKAVDFADRSGIHKLAMQGAGGLHDNVAVSVLARYGTAVAVAYQNLIGSLPSLNYDRGTFDGWEQITGERLYETLLRGADQGMQNVNGRGTCYACSVRCKRVVEAEFDGKPVEPQYGGPEFETLATFGAYCNVDDLPALAFASRLCNAYGADTISAGATVAFAMDCYEHGLVSPADAGGIEPRFGSAKAMLALLEQMLTRSTPLGDLLAEGSARAAARIGGGAEALAVTVKNLELPAHMPQAKRSLGLIYAVNPFGADHQSSEHDPFYEEGLLHRMYGHRLEELGLAYPQSPQSLGVEKIRFALTTQHLFSALDSFGLCQFVFGPAWALYSPNQMIDLVRLATGWDYTLEELMRLGERRLNMLRAFNVREGFDRSHDALPIKLFKEIRGGATDGMKLNREEIERAKDIYYDLCGWNVQTGNPTRAKLQELGLGWVADKIEA